MKYKLCFNNGLFGNTENGSVKLKYQNEEIQFKPINEFEYLKYDNDPCLSEIILENIKLIDKEIKDHQSVNSQPNVYR